MSCLNTIKHHGNKYIRKPKIKMSNLENEVRALNLLGFKAEIKSNGNLEREWIKGELIKTLNDSQKQMLVNEIEKIHALPQEGFTVHNWRAYEKHVNQLTRMQVKRFNYLADKYQGKDLVVSHNDLNMHNMLWDGEKIIPIDFEWCNLNHPLFDYVQFAIAEGVALKTEYSFSHDEHEAYHEIMELSLYYFIMWSYEMPQVKEVIEWRANYWDLIRLYINN